MTRCMWGLCCLLLQKMILIRQLVLQIRLFGPKKECDGDLVTFTYANLPVWFRNIQVPLGLLTTSFSVAMSQMVQSALGFPSNKDNTNGIRRLSTQVPTITMARKA